MKPFYYVTATDKFLSGWGMATGKVHKLIVVCKSMEQARRVEKNMKKDRTLSRVNIALDKPYYPKGKYTTKTINAENAPLWNK